jgi:hypothetical protein
VRGRDQFLEMAVRSAEEFEREGVRVGGVCKDICVCIAAGDVGCSARLDSKALDEEGKGLVILKDGTKEGRNKGLVIRACLLTSCSWYDAVKEVGTDPLCLKD